jgi:hypothetical protein
MTIIPPYISEECKSNAEKKVFKSFENINIASKSYLFHSVNLPEHQYKQWGEIDFLLISTNGIMVFEVKGGRVSRKDGVWTYTDRFGKNHKSTEGPNEQAKNAMFALKKKLSKEFPKIDFKKVTVGWAMIFPDVDYASKTLELPYEMVCDYDSMKGASFDSFINNVFKCFKKKINQPKELLVEEIQKISNYIRPDIDLVPKLKTTIDEANLRLLKGTEEQYSVLNAALENDRILCTGGGGTGKTLLAIEIAKRTLNKKILVVCKNRILAKFIKGQISSEVVDVMSMFEVVTTNFFEPKVLVVSSVKPIYDMLIVDEGQDLLSVDTISLLDALLINGIGGGCWRWFMDINNQAGVDGKFTLMDIPKLSESLNKNGEESVLDKNKIVNIKKIPSSGIDNIKLANRDDLWGYEVLIDAAPVKMKLTHNCRNTEQIIYDTQLNTGADIGEAKIKGAGSYPIYQKVSSIEETATQLEQKLELWSDEINKLNDIVILSSVDYALSSASHLSQKWQDKIQILTEENVLNQNANKIIYSTIANYKGLDKPIVAVIDIEKTMEVIPEYKQEEKDLITKNIESFLYVAMTRSNSILWITVNPKFRIFLKEQQKINFPKMSKH